MGRVVEMQVTQMPEQLALPNFIEKNLSGDEPARCVDGRQAPDSKQGPQMLGGSLLPVVISAIFESFPLDETTVSKKISRLQKAGFKTGVHRGSHQSEDASDCGFADRLAKIIETAKSEKELIASRLLEIYRENQEILTKAGLVNFNQLLEESFEKLQNYSPQNIQIAGEDLIKTALDSNSAIETVQGDHKEKAAYVNLKKGTTLDTRALNQQNSQLFNLDLWMVVKQTQLLGVPQNFSIGLALELYSGTEIELVEKKGKPALPVKIHS